ncbi:MAG: hypothetical protein ABIR19_07680 [Ginsengibacter sp.]
MIILLTDNISPRLQYVADFIFRENWELKFLITTDKKIFSLSEGIKINYSEAGLLTDEIRIMPSKILLEDFIQMQPVNILEFNGLKVFFQTNENTGSFPFDIFGAVFYLISRYEEYLPHKKDAHGRYPHQASVAFKNDFLKIPLVNLWLNFFKDLINHKSQSSIVCKTRFEFIPTYDIDIAYEWKCKSFVRNAIHLATSSLNRGLGKAAEGFRVLTSNQKDPFDIFSWLTEMHTRFSLKPIYFFLVSQKTTRYDKNIHPLKRNMQELIKEHALRYITGIHPSYYSLTSKQLFIEEKGMLEEITSSVITHSKQHYLRFMLPDTFNTLSGAGITDEYSLGYGTINGFRASYAGSFYLYDLHKEIKTNIRMHPFCFMDSNSIFHQKDTPANALSELMYFYNQCKKVNAPLITVMHNHLIGDNSVEWKKMYSSFLENIHA